MSESVGKFKLNTAHLGDWVENTKDIPDQSINCVLTSPPYYGLRDYGEKGQLGLEDTSEEFITNLCNGFEEIKRALRDDGTCWVNIGDTYNKEKSLYGTPFSFALEMVKRGWLLRNTIIWHKESVMPVSVKDRFTCDFEYMFFFTKSKEYWFEQQFEPLQEISLKRQKYTFRGGRKNRDHANSGSNTGKDDQWVNEKGRNMRTTWTINPARQGIFSNFETSHFATFPKKLCMTPIKAGCPPKGIVLDPFLGSGTTGLVAEELGRNWLGFELNPEYLEIAKKRTSQRIC